MNMVPLTSSSTGGSGEAWPDEVLVRMALCEPASFALLFRKYAGPVHQYCYRCLGSREAAEDATQTVFLKAFASLKSCKAPEGFRRWLFTIAHNVIVDSRRSLKPERPFDETEEFADPAQSPEDLAMASLDRVHLTALLAQLPSLQREVVELRLQGMPDKEIAIILGKSHQAIRAAQHRALVQLRALVRGDSTKGGHNAAA